MISDPIFNIHPDARDEVWIAQAYYAKYANRIIAARFGDVVDVAIEAVCSWPQAWLSHMHSTRGYVLKGFPFTIVYKVVDEVVVIYAVAHHKRKPGYWRDRLDWKP